MKRNNIETKFMNFYLKFLEGMDLLPDYSEAKANARSYLVIAIIWALCYGSNEWMVIVRLINLCYFLVELDVIVKVLLGIAIQPFRGSRYRLPQGLKVMV